MGFLRYLVGASSDYNAGADAAEAYMDVTDSNDPPESRGVIVSAAYDYGCEDYEQFEQGFDDRIEMDNKSFFHWLTHW